MSRPNPTISELLNDWQQWPIVHQPELIKQFSQGLNHQTYLIKSAKKLLVLKYFSSPQPNAIEQQKRAFKLGIAPRIIFNSQDHRLTLMDYISPSKQSQTFDEIAIAQSLYKLHSDKTSLTKIQQPFDLLELCDFYRASADEKIHAIHEKLTPALTHFTNDSTSHCGCHNDLVADNCLYVHNDAVFIDWEFAANNNPWFDLASVIVYQNLDDLQAQRFLNTYHNGYGALINTPIFYTSQVAVIWVDILWHLHKFGHHHERQLNKQYAKLNQLATSLDIDFSNSIRHML